MNTPHAEPIGGAHTSTTPNPNPKPRGWHYGDPTPRPGSLGHKILELRKLSGAARRQAEAAFIAAADGFVRRIAGFSRGDDIDDDDRMQAARLGLVLAMQGYDPGVCICFDRFARWKVRGEVARALRDARVVRGCKDRYDGVETIDAPADDDNAVEADSTHELWAALDGLTARQRRLVVDVQMHGRNVVDVAAEIGIGVDEARRELAAARRWLRRELG